MTVEEAEALNRAYSLKREAWAEAVGRPYGQPDKPPPGTEDQQDEEAG